MLAFQTRNIKTALLYEASKIFVRNNSQFSTVAKRKFPLTSAIVKNATFYFYILETLSIEHYEINVSTARCRFSFSFM